MRLHSVPSWWCCLRQLRKCFLIRGWKSLGAGFESWRHSLCPIPSSVSGLGLKVGALSILLHCPACSHHPDSLPWCAHPSEPGSTNKSFFLPKGYFGYGMSSWQGEGSNAIPIFISKCYYLLNNREDRSACNKTDCNCKKDSRCRTLLGENHQQSYPPCELAAVATWQARYAHRCDSGRTVTRTTNSSDWIWNPLRGRECTPDSVNLVQAW